MSSSAAETQVDLVTAVRSGQVKDSTSIRSAVTMSSTSSTELSSSRSTTANATAAAATSSSLSAASETTTTTSSSSSTSTSSCSSSSDGMTLCDALHKGLIEIKTGKIVDRFSGKSIRISEAVKRGLVNPNKLEIYDANSQTKVTLKEALIQELIDEVNGKYDKKMNFQEALAKNFIGNPMTLKECDDLELMMSSGQIKDPISGKKLTILEAIAKGILDVDLKSVKDVKAGHYVSLSQALSDGIIALMNDDDDDPVARSCQFKDTATNESMTLQEAIKKGHLTTVAQKSIFDIEGIKDAASGDYISFNKALEMGIIDKVTGKFVEQTKSRHKIGFKEASDKGFIQPQLLDMLKKPIGIYSADKKRELSLLEAVTEGLIDSHTGLIINTATLNTVPMDKALQLQLITPIGAAMLKSLLNITVTTATVTQTVKRYIQVSSAERDSDNAITFQDALRRGLIDDATGVFTHPDTGKELLLDEAIHLGLLKLSPSASAKSSPDIRPTTEARGGPTRSMSPDKINTTDSSGKIKRSAAAAGNSKNSSVPTAIPPKPRSRSINNKEENGSNTTTTTSNTNNKNTINNSIKVNNNTTTTTNQISSSSSSSTNGIKTNISNGGTATTTSITKNGVRRASTSSRSSMEQQQHKTSNGRSSSMETKSSSNSSKVSSSSAKSSTSLSRKNSMTKSRPSSVDSANDGFRKIPIVVVGGGGVTTNTDAETSISKSVNNNKSTPTSPTKESQPSYNSIMPSPTLSRRNSVRRKSQCLEIPEMPACGWSLKEAIDYRLFDPQTGMYQGNIPFGSALEQGFIQYTSVTVATTDKVSGKGITISLKKALESSVITPEGQYNDGRKLISLHDAIMTGKIWHVWKSASQKAKEAAKAKERKKFEVIEISKGITYNKVTKTFHFSKDITAADLLLALKEGKIRPQDILVLHGPDRHDILEAISKNILDKSTGDYSCQTGQTMSLLEAIQAEFIIIVGAPGIEVIKQPPPPPPKRPQSIDLNGANKNNGNTTNNQGSILTLRNGTIRVRIIESGVTTTRISTFMVEVPGTGEEVTLEEAVKRGLISEETASMYQDQETTSTNSKIESVIIMVTDPDTGIEMRSEEAIAKGIVTEEEILELLKMKNDSSAALNNNTTKSEVEIQRSVQTTSTTCQRSVESSSSSSSSGSNSSSDEADNGSYRSELTIDFGTKTPDVENLQTNVVQTNVVFLKQGYVLCGMDSVRNMVTGEIMSFYEAKIRGIISDVKDSKAKSELSQQVKLFINEAVAKGLVNLYRGTFTNPMNGVELSIGEAIKHGLLITEIHQTEEIIELNTDQLTSTISLNDAFKQCFDAKTRKFFWRQNSSEEKSSSASFTLQESLEEHWINGQDIIFDTTTNTQRTLDQALKDGLINGQTCDYQVNKQLMFILDAAKQGLVGIFPEAEPEFEMSEIQYTLREAFENGTFHQETSTFFEHHSNQEITMKQALKIGLVDFRSAEIFNTKTCEYCNLLEAMDQCVLNGKTAKVKDLKAADTFSLSEAYEKGLLKDKEVNSNTMVGMHCGGLQSGFEVISFWEAIDREQLDTITGMFYSIHEEKKTMTLEEAIFRKYIDKKSALVKDTWKRKYCSLSEACKKKIIKDGHVMNTTTGKYVNVKEAIRLELIVRDIKNVSLIEMLDFGMYLPHSGRILVPGLEREMSLGEAIDMKLIDHSRTIVKSRVSNRYITLYEAIKVEGVIDSVTGLYAGTMNLLEARSKGYLLSVDAMVI